MKLYHLTKRKLWNPEIQIKHLYRNDSKEIMKEVFFDSFFFCFFLLVILSISFSLFLFYKNNENEIATQKIKNKYEEHFFLLNNVYNSFETPFKELNEENDIEYKNKIKNDMEGEEKNKFKPFLWKGEKAEGSALSPNEILQCFNDIEEIFGYQFSKNLKLLIIETMAIESHFGRVIGKTEQSAQGVLQIMPSTHKYVIENLSKKEKYSEFNTVLKKVADPMLPPEKNLRYNVHYNIVFFLWYMESRQNLFTKSLAEKSCPLNSIDRRWKTYKESWNSYHPEAGATKNFYINRAKEASELFSSVNF